MICLPIPSSLVEGLWVYSILKMDKTSWTCSNSWHMNLRLYLVAGGPPDLVLRIRGLWCRIISRNKNVNTVCQRRPYPYKKLIYKKKGQELLDFRIFTFRFNIVLRPCCPGTPVQITIHYALYSIHRHA